MARRFSVLIYQVWRFSGLFTSLKDINLYHCASSNQSDHHIIFIIPSSEDEMSGSVTSDSHTHHSSAHVELMGPSLQVDVQARKDGHITNTDNNESDVEMETEDADVDFDAMRETLSHQNDPND
ncbi:hypothetical protein Tsp_01961 [Trichinella spiralis]|uniref:hypothetical protein n=1 Tax=Trichinella spiralis TaxID=6334 RepID=UPI0001EFB707|nr:conserved hypothetical protein [Trichinella spiralis]XP_003377770.1 hypothetical protein Tsp_01961 [Trichinella spiralis]